MREAIQTCKHLHTLSRCLPQQIQQSKLHQGRYTVVSNSIALASLAVKGETTADQTASAVEDPSFAVDCTLESVHICSDTCGICRVATWTTHPFRLLIDP